MELKRRFDYEKMSTERLEWLLYLNAGLPKGSGLGDEEFMYVCRLIASGRAGDEENALEEE